jgi:hypothetical protein
MFYTKFCPFCGKYGAVGFWRCSDGKTIVLTCDECDATWLNPASVSAEFALFPASPDFIVDNLGCSLSGPKAGWAEREEIKAAGWDPFIAGEGGAL